MELATLRSSLSLLLRPMLLFFSLSRSLPLLLHLPYVLPVRFGSVCLTKNVFVSVVRVFFCHFFIRLSSVPYRFSTLIHQQILCNFSRTHDDYIMQCMSWEHCVMKTPIVNFVCFQQEEKSFVETQSKDITWCSKLICQRQMRFHLHSALSPT